jgi:uncharacterized protein YecA (UPF0149 family)
MSGLSRHLKQLDEELLALGEEKMLLEELDGFIAGSLVCPDLVKPGEWLPIVWNRDSADQQPAFENLDHVNRVLGLVMEHYNRVARTLMERPDRYSPLFSVDTRNGVKSPCPFRPRLWSAAPKVRRRVQELPTPNGPLPAGFFSQAHARYSCGQTTRFGTRLPPGRLRPEKEPEGITLDVPSTVPRA